jgi:hypothetical protein
VTDEASWSAVGVAMPVDLSRSVGVDCTR